jgi:hypothetical protein
MHEMIGKKPRANAGLEFQVLVFLPNLKVQRAFIDCSEIHVTDFGRFDGAAWLG